MTFPSAKVLVLDDEQYICDIIVEGLAGEKYDVTSFCDPREAMTYLQNHPIDLVLTDLMMNGHSGVDILQAAQTHQTDAIVILMTAHPTLQTAVSVLKQGAYDFLVKPFKLEMLKAAIRRGLAHQRMARENVRLKGQVDFLKTCSAVSAGVDIDKNLLMILSSCKTELGASAAAIIEVHPRSGRVVRRLHETSSDADRSVVLDDTLITNFSGRHICEPFVRTEQVQVDGEIMTRTLISSPIYVRRRLQGVINLLVVDKFYRVSPGQMDVLTILTNSAGSAIANNMLYQDLRASYLQAIRALANAIEARDMHTAGHTDRVIRLAEPVARYMGWSEGRINSLIVGCTLHDIGKIGVPDSILNKPDRLTEEERMTMINHPLVGLRIIQDIELFKPSIPYIIAHHERYDGEGYPNKLRGNEIPVEGRLLAVVDTFDAIMSDRPYRKGAPLAVAVSELVTNRGKQFDPRIVDIFLDVIRQRKINLVELYGQDFDLSCLEPATASETVSA